MIEKSKNIGYDLFPHAPEGAVNPSLSRGMACMPASSSKKYTCLFWSLSSSSFATASARKTARIPVKEVKVTNSRKY